MAGEVSAMKLELPKGSLSLNATNVFDDNFIVTQQSNIGAGVPNPRYWWNQPRTVSLNLGFRF